MDSHSSERRKGSFMAWASIGWMLLVLLALLYASKFHLEDSFGTRARKAEILSRMRINLLKSHEAEKSAVMALDDEQSRIFADQSRKASDAAEHDLRELETLLAAGQTDKEARLMTELRACWQDFRRTDTVLLELAVRNTNLKAAALSCTKAAESMARFEHELAELIGMSEDPKIAKLAFRAVSAASNIHTLQAPHIHAFGSKHKDDIESVMKTRETQVRTSLDALSAIPEVSRALLEKATAAFAEFMGANAEVIRLSRLNTNIKSVELSLGKKREAAARCEEILNRMRETVRGRPPKASG